jgi:hypothetical protein
MGLALLASCQLDDSTNPSDLGSPAADQLMKASPTLLGRGTGVVTPSAGGTIALVTAPNIILDSRLTFPPQSVVAPETVTFSLYQEVPPPGLVAPLNRGYYFTPDGVTFQEPCTLHVSFVDANVGSNDPTLYRCYYYNQQTTQWVLQQTTAVLSRQEFVVPLSHFSRYAFGR